MSLLSGSLLAGGTEHPQLPEVPSFWFVSVSTEPGVVLVSKALCWCFGIKPKKVPNVSKLNRNQLKSTEINWKPWNLDRISLVVALFVWTMTQVPAPDGRSKVDDYWDPAKKARPARLVTTVEGLHWLYHLYHIFVGGLELWWPLCHNWWPTYFHFLCVFFLPFQLSFFFLVGWDWSIYSIYSPTMDFELIHFCSAPFTGMGLDICQFVLESHDWTENPLENQWKSSWINHWNGLEASRCWLRSCGVIRSFWIGCWTLTRTTSQEMPGARSWKAWATAAYASSYMEVS